MIRAWPCFLFLLVWVLLGTTGCGAEPMPAATPRAATALSSEPQPAPRSSPLFLWRAQHEGSVVHLLGSIHVANPEIYPLDPRIEQAFEQSDNLVLELDLDKAAESDAGVQFMEIALLPRGQSLDELMDAETRGALHERLDALGIAPEAMQRFRPWFVAMVIQLKQLEKAGFSGAHGIDQYFRDRAAGKKPILELETLEEQLAVLRALGEEAQIEDLRFVLEEDPTDDLTYLTERWQAGDTEALVKEVEAIRTEYPEAYRVTLLDRNVRMAEKIDAFLETGESYFVVVGSAHLVGPHRIQRLLEDKGHPIERP